MRIFHQTYLLILAVALSLSVYAEDNTPQATSKRTELHIGVILPLTGSYANFGVAGQLGIEAASEEIKSKEIKFYYEDSQNNPATAVTAFNRLVADNHADLLIVLSTACASAVLPLAEAHNIPIFMWTASEKLSTNHPQAVRLMSSGSEQGKIIAAKLREEGKAKIAFFSGQGEFFQAVTNGFWESFADSQPRVTVELPTDAADFRTEIAKAKSAGVEKFGVCLATGQTSAFIKQAKELFPEVKLFGCHSASSPDILKALQDLKLSLWFVEGVVDSKFIKQIAQKNPDTSGIWVAAAFHEIVLLISQNLQVYLNNAISIDPLIGKCTAESAFAEKACIVKKADNIFLDVKLGITKIEDGSFIRNRPYSLPKLSFENR